MSKLTRPSPTRLKQILQRQDPPAFGQDYIPAIKASREEAPSRSRPAWVWWESVGRDLSTLSSVERAILLICLHNDHVWEVHDQRMLPTVPRPHPLAGHPKANGMNLPPMRGTIDVANSLGLLRFHPLIRIPSDDVTAQFDIVPFPWIGDLLLFLEDAVGPYNVNLNIKGTPKEFEQADINGDLRGHRADKSLLKTKARHSIETQLYADVGIRTLQLTRQDYDEHVVANLTQIFLWHSCKSPFRSEQRAEIISSFKGSFITGETILEVAWTLCRRYECQLYDIKVVFYQALWTRNIRVDLFQPVLFDKPLRQECRDVLSVYGDWFKR